MRAWLTAVALAASLMVTTTMAQSSSTFDVVIYGGTSGGIAAAVQAADMGKTVALIEPTARIGGMTTNGLSATDFGDTNAIQGLSRQFYRDLGAHYGKSIEFRFEPSVALDVYNDWISTRPNISLVTQERLDLSPGSVVMTGNHIDSIRMESGLIFNGSMFIDAGYEGDLMAMAGVSYHVGREANSAYGEVYNGVQKYGPRASNHNFSNGVSPYVIAGDPGSGLLPGIESNIPGPEGAGDHRLQSYNFRLTVTKASDRRAWTAPANYEANNYELLRRYIDVQGITEVRGNLLKLDSIQGGKYDMNNQGAVSTDFIGQNYAYPDADHATREQIVQAHRDWQQGLIYFLATDASLPQSIRDEMNSYGLAADEFTDNDGWSEQIYVREARRMIGEHVTTDRNILGQKMINDSIGLGSYTMDSHHTQRYVDSNGNVCNEGNVQQSVPEPYRISFGSIKPVEAEADNLLVTSAVSASHIAYGSIRMEPVFMTLGQAGGAAAALAINEGVNVQNLDYQILRQQLIAGGALLEWPHNTTPPAPSASMSAQVDFNDLSSLPVNLRNQTTGEGFIADWDGTGTQQVIAGDLTYAEGGYNITQDTTGPAGRAQGSFHEPRQSIRALSMMMTDDVWLSFLLENPDSTAVAGLSLNPTTNGDPEDGPIANYIAVEGDEVFVSLGGAVTSGVATLTVGDTHLILAHLAIDDGGNDEFQIWLDPSDVTTLGEADFTASGADWFSSITVLGLLSHNPADNDMGGYLDAIRISNRAAAYKDVTGAAAPGDADGDGDVDIDDFVILKNNFGASPLVDDRADFNDDGDVDIDDFFILKNNFGT